MPICVADGQAVLFRSSFPNKQTRPKLKRTTMWAALVSGLLIPALVPFGAQGQTLPSGGQVIAGQAGIAGSGSNLTISQSSDKAVIDWSSFSIGQGGTVQFNNGSGATLNRVTGGNLSAIDGLLSATGSVYLINPNGVIIGQSGVVKVGGGFTASTLDIGNANFLNGGDLTFEGPSLASVVNLGQIGALGGDVALVAANVRNDGTIAAPNGALGLLAGNRVLMRDAAINDGKFLVLSGAAGTSAANTGSIEAATAELRAQGGNVYALAGNTQSLIRATGVSSHDGRMFLSAGTGSVNVSGSMLSATQNGEGGTITITGQKITVASDATFDASGATTGGSVTAIADMASGQLDFHGTALAKGSLSGGFVETSGNKVNFAGTRINTTGAKSGNWLVDPDDLTVDASAATTIQTNLATTNVTLQTTATTASGPGNSTSGSGDIFVNSDITWSSANTLTLDSYHSIQINAKLTASGAGGVVLTTANGGDYAFAYGKSLSFTGSGGSLTINGNAYTLVNSMTGLAGLTGGSGRYALAKSLDASGTTYTNSVVTGSFTGTLTGLGNTVSNLTINAPATNNIGLFSQNDGTLRDIGVLNANITGNGYSAALAGRNQSVIKNAFASGAVVAGAQGGGLIGINTGTVSNVFATTNVQATNLAGGLIGDMANGTLSNAYATGSVSAPVAPGGLVGVYNSNATITSAYATGKVTTGNPTYTGGAVGFDAGGNLTSLYFDSGTTGQSDNKGTAQTTAQLQGALPSGFSSSVWGTGTGLYPYLKSFYPNGAQAISGTVDNTGTTPVITAYAGGAVIGSTKNIGANNYYYVLIPGTGLTGTTPIGVSYSYGSNTTLSFNDAPTLTGSNFTGLDLHGQYAEIATSKSLYSDTLTGLNTAFGASTISSLMSGLNLTTNGWINYDASGDYTIDQPVTLIRYTDFSSKGNLLSVNADITVPSNQKAWFFSNKSIDFNANVSATGTSAVTIVTNNNSGSGGDYSFLKGKSLTFSGTGGFLNINGDIYTLLYNQSDFEGIEFGSGYYALAKGLDFTGSSFSASVIAQLDGTFTGMGNTISGMSINGTGVDYVGLIGTLSNAGTVRDVGINGGAIYGHFFSGPLIGHNEGLVLHAWSSADAHVAYRSGGLVGHNEGTIKLSHATGAVTSLGDNGGGVSDMGGLLGWNDVSGIVDQSYATGTVTGISDTTGGLVAYNGGGTISNSFATGGVFGNHYAGGLVGFGDNNGTISNSYSTGYVHANTSGGGLAGHFIGTITNSYWDKTTSGIASAGVGDGTGSGAPVGLTRSVLQNGSLPTGFSSAIWTTGAGLYPYFKAIFPTGMQSISGFTYASNGSGLPAATLAVYVNGTQVGNTTAASGADGYYYLMTTPGTVTGSTKIGITETVHNAGSVSATAYTDTPTLTNGQVTGFNVTSGRLTYNTSETTYSALKTSADTTFGPSLHNSLTTALDAAALKIVASSAFAIDQAISRSGTALIQSGGNLTVTSGGSVTSTASGTAVSLAADGSFINNAGASSVSASNGRWLIYTQAHGNATAAATANSFGGLTAKNFYNDAFNFGTGLFATTPNSGNRFVTGYAPVLTATPDTKTLVYNGAARSDTYTLSGYLAGDQSADNLTGSVNALTASSKNAGAYNLTASGTLASDLNYTISYGSGTLTIGKKALTIAAGTDSKTYDTNMTSTGTVTVTGLEGLDSVTGRGQAFDSKNAGTRTLNVTGYTVNDGNSGNNYTVTTQTAAGSIAKAALTAGLAGTTTKTYDATLSAALTAGNYTLAGIKGSDTVTLNNPALGSYGDGNVGTGKAVTASGLALLGTDAGNYTVNGTASGNIGSITPRALTLSADNRGKFSGATDPALTYAITAGTLAGADAMAGNLSRTTGENPGVYDINQGSLTASSNYDVTFVKGAFTITAVALQNDPVVNPLNSAVNTASQPTIKPAPIGLSGPSDAGGAGSDASGTGGSASDAGSAAGEGDEKATGPSVKTVGQSGDTCESGEACANTPYPDNQSISSSISFTSK